jgi:hypothetical protein
MNEPIFINITHQGALTGIELTPQILAQILGDVPGRLAKLEQLAHQHPHMTVGPLAVPSNITIPHLNTGSMSTLHVGPGLAPLQAQQPAQPVTTEDSPAKMRSVASALSYNEAPKEASAKHLLLWGAMRIEALERAQRKTTAADGGAGEAESDDTCEIERLRDSLHIMANQSARYMKERDDLAKRLEAVTRELAAYKTGQAINDDAMRTLAAELGDGKECISTNTDAINAARIIKQERDKALADLAAERAAHGLEKQAHEHTWNHKAELIADLAAANERAERAEKLADSLAGNGGR